MRHLSSLHHSRGDRHACARPRRCARLKKRSSHRAAYSSNGAGVGGHGRRAVIFSPQPGSWLLSPAYDQPDPSSIHNHRWIRRTTATPSAGSSPMTPNAEPTSWHPHRVLRNSAPSPEPPAPRTSTPTRSSNGSSASATCSGRTGNCRTRPEASLRGSAAFIGPADRTALTFSGEGGKVLYP